MYNYVCIYNIGCSGDPESHWIPGTKIHMYIAILINSPDGWRFFSCTFCKMKPNPPTDYKDYKCTSAFMRINCSTLFAGVNYTVYM